MTTYSFGDIVLLAFPFTDTKKKKKRPALVLFDSNDGDVILCRITSQLTNTDYDYIIEDWDICGLLLPSVVRLHKIATLEKALIEKKLGFLNQTEFEKLKKKIDEIVSQIIAG